MVVVTLVPLGPWCTRKKYYTTDFYVLEKALENRGAKVLMTRTTDVDVYGPNASGVDELGARVNVANRSNSDALISCILTHSTTQVLVVLQHTTIVNRQ